MDDLLLELKVRSWDLRVGEDLEKVKKSWNGGMWLRVGRIFRTKDDFGKVGCGGGSRMDSESCRFLAGYSWQLGHMVSS